MASTVLSQLLLIVSNLGEEITLLICPGIFGSYNKSYVQSTIGAACARGYRIVCLNHLGVLDEVELKTPRLFTYGNTEVSICGCIWRFISGLTGISNPVISFLGLTKAANCGCW